MTIDAYGTLVTLRDPVPALREALRLRGVERTAAQVAAAFRAEVAYYRPRSHEGRDAASLAALRRDCVRVFLDAAAVELDTDEFTPAFLDAFVFEPVPGARAACAELERRGIPTAVVSNWDIDLHAHLAALEFDLPVVTSAEAGAPKPDPAAFRLALARLGVAAAEAVHIGDGEEDEQGARAAGMRFEPAPLPTAVRRLLAPARYGRLRVAAWFGIVGALAALNYGVRFAGGSATRNAERNAVYHYSTAVTAIVFYAIFFAFVYAIAAADRRELFALRRPRSWPSALGLAVAVIGALLVVNRIVELLPLPQSPGREQGLTPTQWHAQYAGAFAANLVALAVVAPVIEELTFRGVGYRLLQPFGVPVAVVAVGVMFGLAHGLVEGLLVLIPFGILVAWLRSRTDSVYPGMLVHATFNGIALLSVLFS